MAAAIDSVCVASVLVLTLFVGASPTNAQSTAPGDATVVALVDGRPVTDAQLSEQVGGRLQRLRTDEYNIKRTALDELVVERVLQAEAARHSVTVAALLQHEVTEKIQRPLDIELRAVFEATRDRYPGLSESEALRQIGAQLTAQRVQRRRAEYIGDLKRAADIRVRLEPPRLSVETGESPIEGPATAPVTIVEFSDFECPYCAQLAQTLKRIRVKYSGRIRFAYRHMPLPMHPNAQKAAEVLTCAMRQDRFWFMHDKLFESQRRVQAGDWMGMARESGMDLEAMARCLESPDISNAWKADQKAAESYGITGTPALFVNGRLFNGAVSFDTLSAAIEEELGR